MLIQSEINTFMKKVLWNHKFLVIIFIASIEFMKTNHKSSDDAPDFQTHILNFMKKIHKIYRFYGKMYTKI